MGGSELAPGEHPQPREFSVGAGRLARGASAHLLAAGLELRSALPLVDASKATNRCARALGDIDDAIKLIRQLAVAAGVDDSAITLIGQLAVAAGVHDSGASRR